MSELNAVPPDAVEAAAEARRQHQAVSLNKSHVDCSCGWSIEPTPKPGERALLIAFDNHQATAALRAAQPAWEAWLRERIVQEAAEKEQQRLDAEARNCECGHQLRDHLGGFAGNRHCNGCEACRGFVREGGTP